MNWKLCDKDIWLKVDFDTKEVKKGAQYDGDKNVGSFLAGQIH